MIGFSGARAGGRAAPFQRTSDGFVLTDEGQARYAHAISLEEEDHAMQRQLAGSVAGLYSLFRPVQHDRSARS